MKQLEVVLDGMRTSIAQIDPHQVDVNDPALVLLDCRDAEEFANAHIAAALSVPRAQLEMRVEDLIPQKQQPVLVYCASGMRSLFAARTLLELGYSRVSSLAGGIQAWKAAGRPVQSVAAAPGLDRERYQSQMRLFDIGEAGQLRLLKARVLVIGAGGLGSPVALYLAAAGVGCIGLVDHDQVDRSNLQRQILHTTDRIGFNKVDSAAMALRALNSDVQVERHARRLDQALAEELFPKYDLIVDGSDNFSTRYLVNRVCHAHGKRSVHGSVFQWQGQVSVFGGAGPCYECLFPAPPEGDLAPNCAEGGVIGAITGVVGASMACEVIKLLCDIPGVLQGKLVCFDLKGGAFDTLEFEKDPDCACCQHPPRPISPP